MRRILITGTNRGIGLSLVQHYVQTDALILATCRRPGVADELQQVAAQHPDRVKVLQLDVIDSQSIDGCVDEVRQHTDGLDMLINNAGIMALPDRELTAQNFEKQFGVNHMGHFLLTKLLLEKVKKSE